MSALPESTTNRRIVGAKARVLRELADAGFPVPLFEVSPSDLPSAITRLGTPLAVRSCAAVEDGQAASFAGLFLSVLNVTGLAELENAVVACKNSCDTAPVRDYLLRQRNRTPSIAMDVIVQRMVSAKLSGVAFSIDPLTGNDRVVIEASEGLGENLLSGRSQPIAGDHPLLGIWRERIEALAMAVQRHYGTPQDIEFAIDDDGLWLLQARPITRIQFANDAGSWTNADFRDGGVSASVCSPLMWSLYERAWRESLLGFLREIRLLRHDDHFEPARMFFGRPYWNLGAVKGCLAALPGYVERQFDEDLSVHPTYEGDGVVTPTNLKTVVSILPTVWKLRRFFSRQESTVRAFLNGGFEQLVPAHESAVGTGTDRLRSLLAKDFWTTEILYFRTIFAASLAKLDFKDAFPEADEISLVAGLGPLRHLEPLTRMQDLRQSKKFHGREIEVLLEEFKHHQPSGLDVIHPRWDEQRSYVERLFAASQNDAGTRRVSNASCAHQEHLAKLSPQRRVSFTRKLDRLRTFLFLREEMRDCSSRMYYLIRRFVLEIAKERGLGDDLFFVSYLDVLEDNRKAMATGRDVYERFRNFHAPNEIGGGVGTASQELAASSSGLFKGIAASRGFIRGVARIVHSAEEVSRLDRDVIVVCKFVDPGWTCVLERASGVVTETGGLLSHAAVICREFGLPTVLGVQDATKRIRDGQVIEVDGNRGEVHVVEKSMS